MRWILLMLASVASSSDSRFVPDAMIDASAVCSELRLTRCNPDANWPVVLWLRAAQSHVCRVQSFTRPPRRACKEQEEEDQTGD
jgi:hypothetical protein